MHPIKDEPLGSATSARGVAMRRDPAGRPGDTPRVPELDALRGLAAMAVVVFHADARWFRCGWAAVDLFFVLSGYLITTIILRHRANRGFLASFYARRALRIWPLYYVVVGLVAAISPWLKYPPDWSALPAVLTFTQDLSEMWTGHPAAVFSPYLGHLWTLAVEEQFYLIWPALVLLAGRGRVARLAVAVAAASVAARWSGLNYALLIARADGLAMGALLAALAMRAGDDPGRRRGLARGSLAALLGGAAAVWLLGGLTFLKRVPSPGPVMLAYNVTFLGAVGLIVTGAGRPALAFLRWRPLVRLGSASYGLYLIHQPVLQALVEMANSRGIPGRPARVLIPGILASVALAALSYHRFEAPLLALKARFGYADAEGRRSEPGPTRRRQRDGTPSVRL
ncbi:O-acetyltransferase OatA [Aquisphaera giovannonii]|uniref:O-acetyltransferase OatA n=1 Tax=Aquisphaera giovannonii TaxID=406548 RepID=A0A5B9VV20_9BACT|nr:acyltransferase [Aquisphaera giovannonii]QEH31969.1 O-acetyltransferase OatA [Aquisphaera giovannonii]